MWLAIIGGFVIYALFKFFFYGDDVPDVETSDSTALCSVANRLITINYLTMGERSLDLPQDIWDQIFKKLDEHDLEQVSLVSKQFLSLANPLKTSLNIFDETLPILPGILRRFQRLENIIISIKNTYDIVGLLNIISGGRKNLKRLIFKKEYMGDKVFIIMADLFPWLEEINCFPLYGGFVTYEVWRFHLPKFTGLKKVTIEHTNVSALDVCFTILSLNCVNLEELDIKVRNTYNVINEETIGYIMRNSPKLTTLKLPKYMESYKSCDLAIHNSVAYAKNLHTFCFHAKILSSELADSLSKKANISKLEVHFRHEEENKRFKNSCLLDLIQGCCSLQDLCVENNKLLLDSSFDTISHRLGKLIRIDLCSCYELTNITFFTLIKKCPLLEEIKMDFTSIGKGDFSTKDLLKHEKIRYLSLHFSLYLDDKTLAYILWVCPNLHFIDVSSCPMLTSEALSGILKKCVSLNHLSIYRLENICDIFGEYFEGKNINLKILEAGSTKLNDKALSEIGKICSGLECLSIRRCKRVTNNGVIELVKKCEKLKKIDLYMCENLSLDILDDIVRLRPSIKRIILPNDFVLSEKQRDLFWNNGCKICDSDDEFPFSYSDVLW